MLTVRVIRTPNFSVPHEYEAIAAEPEVDFAYVYRPQELGVPDLVVLPGSKRTIPDLLFLRESGMDRAIEQARAGGATLLGICGGFQIMGTELQDLEGFDSEVPRATGLAIFDLTTTFGPEKINEPVGATAVGGEFLREGEHVSGFELHRGRSTFGGDGAVPLFREMAQGGSECPVGLATGDYGALGTYLHGVLADPVFRRGLLEYLRRRRTAAQELSRHPVDARP